MLQTFLSDTDAVQTTDADAAQNAETEHGKFQPIAMRAPRLPGEEARISALNRYEILDTMPERAYDDIVLLASQICGAPIAMMSLVDHDRQWFKSALGWNFAQTPRDYAFCAFAIAQPDDLMVVPDAQRDSRFQFNPFVMAGPKIRFYAGAPLVTSDGHALGTLCVIDQQPRELTVEQKSALSALSRQVMAQLELRVKMRELNQSEQRFQEFMDNSPALTFIKDTQGRFVYVNKPFLHRFGLQDSQVCGKTDWDLWPPEIAHPLREHDQKVLAEGRPAQLSEAMPTPDGEQAHWLVYKFPLRHQTETLLGVVAVDVTQSKLYEQKLEEAQRQLEAANSLLAIQSSTDALTELSNRRAFNSRIDVEWQRVRRQNGLLSLLLLDIDRFKQVNDSFGHPAGDTVLQQVAQVLRDAARLTDVVARFGGEEFAVISPDTSLEGALTLAERFRLAIESAPWKLREITISIGVATVDFSNRSQAIISDTAQLIEAADSALYAAKQNGRNRVEAAKS